MTEQEYNTLKKRYNGLVETVQELGAINQTLRDENEFIKNEKIMWGQQKAAHDRILITTINRFNTQIANLNEEIVKLRDRLKEIEGDG